MTSSPKFVLLLGSTGTIGAAVLRRLLDQGHEVTRLARPRPDRPAGLTDAGAARVRLMDVHDAEGLAREVFADGRYDAVISCMASRTGAPADAWSVDYQANLTALTAAKAAGVGRFILVSAICVQKPRLAFQHAKLAFEQALIASGAPYVIVRPTAYFKSLCGQIERLRAGRPFLMFGDGEMTACKAISDHDLASYIVDCLDDDSRLNRILPIGGPGGAVTPRQQGEALFALLGLKPRFQSAPLSLLDGVAGVLGVLGRVSKAAADKAEFARIGRYYASESMLVWDPLRNRYDAAATPEWGGQSLFDFYAEIAAGAPLPDRGEHAVF